MGMMRDGIAMNDGRESQTLIVHTIKEVNEKA